MLTEREKKFLDRAVELSRQGMKGGKGGTGHPGRLVLARRGFRSSN